MFYLCKLPPVGQRPTRPPHILSPRATSICAAFSLARFAETTHGHVHIDSNHVENSIRPSALGKKNFLFVGHPNAGGRSAVLYSVLGTCKLHGINEWRYLTWALTRLAAATNQTAHRFTPQLFAKESG